LWFCAKHMGTISILFVCVWPVGYYCYPTCVTNDCFAKKSSTKNYLSNYLKCLWDFILGENKNQGGFSGNGLIIHNFPSLLCWFVLLS
jgi:hypothetical protein